MGLKDLRKASGMTQREAAEYFGLKYRTYQNYENGETSPDMDTAATFTRHFHCTIGELFDLKEGGRDVLTDDEAQFLAIFRDLSETGREALLASAQGIRSAFPRKG